ncbi:hypothetical protein NDU88_005205 [Pleurodeles waltl]|uniref:Uncharacterized protein n=1 Tax=Pleurodeles waltl TaxID=8319 RepID=A0AAV7RKC9_PLEWA|nr:hypothetical protein NDU88_005205 [Pleurodeles waltl]
MCVARRAAANRLTRHLGIVIAVSAWSKKASHAYPAGRNVPAGGPGPDNGAREERQVISDAEWPRAAVAQTQMIRKARLLSGKMAVDYWASGSRQLL